VAVAVCDHGSPTRAVSLVRDHVASQVAAMLMPAPAQETGPTDPSTAPASVTLPNGVNVSRVSACSMERREGSQYDFCEPILERLLRTPGWDEGRVIVAMLFISPGKHAGEGGDVAGMIEEATKDAQAQGRSLHAVMTPLLGAHPLFDEVLADRIREATRG
jgi:hypothetical protein